MPGEAFYWVLNMAFFGSLAGLAVLALRRVKRLPRGVCLLLWAIPAIRLWILVGVGSAWSLQNLLRGLTRTVVVYEGGPLPDITATNVVRATESYTPFVYKTARLETFFSVAGLLWAILAAAAVLTALALYAITKSELRDAQPVRDNIYRSDKLLSPAVFGVLRPKIILPAYMDLDDKDTQYALLHENAHIRRGDNLWRLLAVLTGCVFWFNPLVWVFLKAFLEDMELSCDARVLRRCGEGCKKDYAAALLRCEQQKTVFSCGFGGAKTRTRVESILSYRRLTVLSAAASALLLAVFLLTLLTNAA